MSVRIVKFNCHGCHAPAYGCSFPGDNTGEYVLHSDYASLLARHNALREAVEWEREFDEVLVWLVQSGRYPRDMAGKYDLADERECARAEVDRLLKEPTP